MLLQDLSHLHDSSYGMKEYPAAIPPDWDDIPGIRGRELGRIAKSGELGRAGHRSGELGRASGRSGELGRSGRSGELGRTASRAERELGRRSGELAMGRRSGELGRKSGDVMMMRRQAASAAPSSYLSKSATAPASRFRDPLPPPPAAPRPQPSSVRTAPQPRSYPKSQHARSHARFQPNLETQNETSEHSDEDRCNLDSEEEEEEEENRDGDQEQDQEEVKKDVIVVQSQNYGLGRQQQQVVEEEEDEDQQVADKIEERYWSRAEKVVAEKPSRHSSGRDEAPEEESIKGDPEEKIAIDLEVGVEILTARMSKSGELGLPSGRKSHPERVDSGNRRSGAVPFKWEQEPGVSKYKEEEQPGLTTTVGGKTISLSGPLTPPPGAVAAAAAAARAAAEKEAAAAAKDKSITDKMRSILAGKFSGQLKPPLPPPPAAVPPPPAAPVASRSSRPAAAAPPKAKKVSFFETDVVVTFDNAANEESSPVSILDRPESPTSPPYSPPHCPAPHGPAPQSPLKPPPGAGARRPGTVGGMQLAQHLVQLTGMVPGEKEDHERDNSSADEQESDPDAIWDDAADELSEPSSWSSSNNGSSRRVHPLPAGPNGMTKSHSVVDSPANRVRRPTRVRGDSWSAGGSPTRRGGSHMLLDSFEQEADLSDLEYESQRIKAPPGPAAPPKRDIGKPPLARPGSRHASGELGFHGAARQVSGDLGLLRPGPGAGSRHVSGELGLTAPPVSILKTGGSRQVSGELGLQRPAHHGASSRHVSGELGLARPSGASRPVSGELGRVHISTRPTTGSVPSSPEREVYHSAPGSVRSSRRASGELSYPLQSADSSPTRTSYGGGSSSSSNVDRSGPTSGSTEDPPESDHDREFSGGQHASGRIRNPFGSLKGEPMIKNGRIIYAGNSSFDDDDFSFEERADEVVHTVDESLYAISPIASAFVFPGSAGSTPSASPQVHLTGSTSQKNSGFLGNHRPSGSSESGRHLTSASGRNLSFEGGPRLVRSGTVTVPSTRHSVSNSFDNSFPREDGVGSNIMNGSTLLRRLSNVETEIDKPAKTAMNCAMACLPFRSLLGLKSSSPAVSRRNSRLSIASHRDRDPFEDRLRAT